MTVNLTVILTDRPLHQGTFQHNAFLTYLAMERTDGYQESGEEVPKTHSCLFFCHAVYYVYKICGWMQEIPHVSFV